MVKICLLDPLWKNSISMMKHQEISLERLKKKNLEQCTKFLIAALNIKVYFIKIYKILLMYIL